MATLFTKIINGELPGRFVWRDDQAVAFMTIAPLKPGHTLVVPIAEVDHWVDLEASVLEHLTKVSHAIGKAIQTAFEPEKVGMMLAGLEVPHVHIHLVPIWGVHDMDFSNADSNAHGDDIEAAAERIRAALRADGHHQVAS
ncbi:MAG: HIT family protein [Acidimicrobiia bacterium]